MQFCNVQLLDLDYSTLPRAEMFRRVLGKDLPAGTEVVAVAGHHAPGSGFVWMKIKGTPKAVQTLTVALSPIVSAFHYPIPTGVFGAEKIYNPNPRPAGWA